VIAMKKLIFVILVVLALAGTVSAQSVTYTAKSDQAVEWVKILADGGTSGTVTFYTANGSTITGSYSYLPADVPFYPFANTATINIGGNSDSMLYVTPGQIYIQTTFIGSFINYTSSRAVMSAGQNSAFAYFKVETPFYSPIVKYTVNADHEVTVTHMLTSRSAVEAGLDPTSATGIIDKALALISSLWTVLLSIMFWIKFLFVDNIVMIVCLYLFGTMAYAMNSSKNIFAFFTTWFRQQSRFFQFVVSVISAVISAIGNIIASFKPL